jgi:hypothetical protein
MVTLAEKTIEIATGEDGEREHPPGSNRGPGVDKYLRAVNLDPTKGAYAWCAALVSWAVYEATKVVGGPPQFKGSAGALRLLELNPGLHIPEPTENCIAVADHGGGKGHAFFILSVNGDEMATFEGNTDAGGSRTGGQAMYRTRRRDECKGFLRIG